MDRTNALRCSRCRERRLNKVNFSAKQKPAADEDDDDDNVKSDWLKIALRLLIYCQSVVSQRLLQLFLCNAATKYT